MGTTTIESSGLPGYTFESAPGESWRSKFDATRNIIVINNGHRDFVYSGRNKSLKLRYLVRLYSKELVLKNFVGLNQINSWNAWSSCHSEPKKTSNLFFFFI